MINIAIIDQNEIFRESLKILLEQINGFRVVLNTDGSNCSESLCTNLPVHVMLIGNNIGLEKCSELTDEALVQWKSMKTLILALYKDELYLDYGDADVILKNSGKKEFENRIKKLIII